MAKKKEVETLMPLEVLPGIPVLIQYGPEDRGEEEFENVQWPQVVASAPVVGDIILSLDRKWGATISQRTHCIDAQIGPTLLLTLSDVSENEVE